MIAFLRTITTEAGHLIACHRDWSLWWYRRVSCKCLQWKIIHFRWVVLFFLWKSKIYRYCESFALVASAVLFKSFLIFTLKSVRGRGAVFWGSLYVACVESILPMVRCRGWTLVASPMETGISWPGPCFCGQQQYHARPTKEPLVLGLFEKQLVTVWVLFLSYHSWTAGPTDYVL